MPYAQRAPSGWRSVAKPIFDELRRKRRDALVAYLLSQKDAPYSTQEQLYEYLLLDPGTEPPVRTSRLQLATASVQLFIRRCLMNLELSVPPDIIDAGRWEWMCRYRAWEAARKMFLWPENWLEPELRDDKTHLFRELESALLQADVSAETVEAALHRYLKQLEEIARLEMMTMYYERGPSAGFWTVHVVGRSQNKPHKYYYRTASNGVWMPWEPMGVEIDGEHLALVLWRDRLHLFWVSFADQATSQPPLKPASPEKSIKDLADESPGALQAEQATTVQLNWVERFGGSWVNRSATSFVHVPEFANLGSNGTLNRDKFSVRVVLPSVPEGKDAGTGPLEVHISHDSGVAAKFVLAGKLSSPELSAAESVDVYWLFPNVVPAGAKYQGDDNLKVRFTSKVTVDDLTVTSDKSNYTILEQCGPYRLLLPSNDLALAPSPRRPPPLAIGGRLRAYQPLADARPQVQHITYRGTDGHIHDVWGEGGVSDNESFWYYTDITENAAQNGSIPGVPASGDPDAIAWQMAPNGAWSAGRLVAYRGTDGDLYLAEWTPDVWSLVNLTADAASAKPEGRPLLIGRDELFFRSTGGDLFSVRRSSSGVWERVLLTAGAEPKAASDPAGEAFGGGREFFYRDGNNHIILMSITESAGVKYLDLTTAINPPALAQGELLVMTAHVTFPGEGEDWDVAVFYRSVDDQCVHELLCTANRAARGHTSLLDPTTWLHKSVGARFPVCDGELGGWGEQYQDYQANSWLHVVYKGKDSHLYEIWEDPAGLWNYRDISRDLDKTVELPGGDPVGYRFDRFKAESIVYPAEHGLQGLRRVPGGGWTGVRFDLDVSLLDDPGKLMTPFFFEDDQYTFFVEPTIQSRIQHYWYPGQQPRRLSELTRAAAPVAAYFPTPQVLENSSFGARAKREREDWLSGQDGLLRTRKGLFCATGALKAGRATTITDRMAIEQRARATVSGTPTIVFNAATGARPESKGTAGRRYRKESR